MLFYKEDIDKFDFNSNNTLDIKKIWNGAYFQNYRRIITGEEKNAQGCNNCEWLIGKKDVPGNVLQEKTWENLKIK